jgi:hypothetical protein
MKPTPDLESIISVCLDALHAHPQSVLELGYRRAVWTCLGDRLTDEQRPAGYFRRVHLALASARKVLPIWEQHFPQEDMPHFALSMAEAVRDGKRSPESVGGIGARYWGQIDQKICEYSQYQAQHQKDLSDVLNALQAGISAIQALGTAIGDELFSPGDMDYSVKDDAVDPYETDAAWCAACVYAHGSRWDQASDAERRREFWEWWLTEAVLRAWKSVSEGRV